MHRTLRYLALALGLIVSAVILVFALRDSRRPKTGFNVQVASPRIVVLHISSRGGLAINSESVPNGQLAGRLREIYGTRAEGLLYLFAENDTPSQCIANQARDPGSAVFSRQCPINANRTSPGSAEFDVVTIEPANVRHYFISEKSVGRMRLWQFWQSF